MIESQGSNHLRPNYSIWNYFWFTDSQPLAKYIATLDPRYNSLFMDNVWKEAFEHSDTTVGEFPTRQYRIELRNGYRSIRPCVLFRAR